MVDDTFSKDKVIGNHAESIIEYIINSMPNWRCIRFGVEHHIEDIKKAVRGNKMTNEIKMIKSMPDFFAFNEETGETFFVEVKYRGFIITSDGKSEYKIDFLKNYNEYWKETKLIIVCPFEPYFVVVNLKDIKDYMSRNERTGQNNWDYYWDFKDIEKKIKNIFPELKVKTLEEAIKMIPKKDLNKSKTNK